jgi:hypothetical protein
MKIDLCDVLFLVYSFLLNKLINTIYNLIDISQEINIAFKDRINNNIKSLYNENFEK